MQTTNNNAANTAGKAKLKLQIRSSRTRRAGRVVINGQGKGIPCAISDLTATTATITAQGWIGVPEKFFLVISPENAQHSCRVSSRRGNAIKVVFVT